jgi:hypothetical protein
VRNAESGASTRIWLPAAALTYEAEVGSVALSDRNRWEQLDGLPGSPQRYRNRPSADWHLPGGHRVSDVFVADEVFYDFASHRWSRNRAQAGVQFDLTHHARLQTFYLRQHSISGEPRQLNVLGLTLQLSLE